MKHTATPWPMLCDMTPEQMMAWGAEESAARIEDLKDRTESGIRQAQLNADARRKQIGASRSQAAALVIDANRANRHAKASAA